MTYVEASIIFHIIIHIYVRSTVIHRDSRLYNEYKASMPYYGLRQYKIVLRKMITKGVLTVFKNSLIFVILLKS